MSSRTLVVVLLACTIGYIAGREGVQSLRVWTPTFARVSAATTPAGERLVPQLIARRRPVVPSIGIVALPESIATRNQLDGVVVQEVVPGSPAAKVGLEGLRRAHGGGFFLGDLIVAVNGKPVQSMDEMTHIFEQQGVGATVELTIVRRGEKRTIKVPLVAMD
jgi:S1-C subfamily serine protease